MNRQIVKLFGLIVVLFAVLVGFTSYWSVFDAKALKEKDANKRPLLEQQQIQRGRILAADGTVIARSVAKGHGAGLRYVRRYPEGALFGHPIGYSFVQPGRQRVREVPQRRAGRQRIRIRLDPRPAARPQPGRQRHRHQPRPDSAAGGARRPRSGGLRRRGRDRAEQRPGAGAGLEPALRPQPRPRTPRPAQRNELEIAAGRPRHPGPVPAGLDLQGGDRRRRPRQRHDHAGNDDRRPRDARRRRPAAAERLQPELRPDLPRHGADQLGQHLVRASSAQQVGEDTLFEYMDRFGFNSTPAIDLPADQVSKSGDLRRTASCSGATTRSTSPASRSARSGCAVTPLQMAEVAAAVANGGKLMKPQIWSRVVDPDGRVVKRLDPSEYSQPIGAADRGRADHGDGRRGQRRHRHQRGDPRRRRSPARPAPRKRPSTKPAAAAPKRTRPGSSASRRPTTRRSRSRRRSSARPSSATTSRRRSSATSPKRS